ncbi:MAG: anthranilate synthase component I [Acidimicrobiales bacterium]
MPHRRAQLLLPYIRRVFSRPGRADRWTVTSDAPATSDAATSPGRTEFRVLAAKHRIVPVWRELVADTLTPVGAFLRIVGDGPGFLLESVEGGERWGRYSFIGRNPLAVVTAVGRTVGTAGSLDLDAMTGNCVTGDGGILSALEAILEAFESPDLPDLPPLHAGLVGYLGYDVVREVEHLPDVPADDLGHPDALVAVIGELAAFDHWRQRVVLIENVVIDAAWGAERVDAAFDEACAQLDTLTADCFRPVDDVARPLPERIGVPEDVEPTMSGRLYMDSVEAAKEHVTAGDIFQVVLSQRFDLPRLEADPFDVYRVLRLVNPSPYLYFLRFPEVTVVGASPEPMVRLRDGVVVSRPIAGSRPRGRSSEEDGRLAGELVEDPKERAEHVMLVDLARNDVGRVVSFGTEKIDEMMIVERYSHIMHMTSQVSGQLAPGKGPIDVLRATLPAGTLSGAPKVRAMEIIDDLEPTKRGVYGGVVGYLDFSGNLDTAIAIRTMTVSPDGRASVQAGAGIVADSDPAAENEECAHKAAAMLAAVAMARAAGAGDVARAQEDR